MQLNTAADPEQQKLGYAQGALFPSQSCILFFYLTRERAEDEKQQQESKQVK